MEEKKIGVIYYNFSFKEFAEFVDWCCQNQVFYAEIQSSTLIRPDSQPEREAEKLSTLLSNNKIRVSQLSAGNDFVQKTSQDMEVQMEKLKLVCRLAHLLQTDQLRIDGGWPKEGVEADKYNQLILDGLLRTAALAEKENLYLALDNHGVITNDYQFQLELIIKVNSSRLGVNLDTMNYRWYGYPVNQLPIIYEIMAPFARHTHLKDGTGTRSEYQGKVLGEGEIPLKDAISALQNNHYKGVWCIEYEGPDKESGYSRCVQWLRKNI